MNKKEQTMKAISNFIIRMAYSMQQLEEVITEKQKPAFDEVDDQVHAFLSDLKKILKP